MSNDESATVIDDDLHLSAHALSALNEFISEQQEQEMKFEKLKQRSLDSIQKYLNSEHEDPSLKEEEKKEEKKEDRIDNQINIDFFKEDWQVRLINYLNCSKLF
ncbi:hypothetical protein Glove_402g26 [Diversispora epigaea]|uniref:Uncharacterized protein n=1 Tax=Diversispora epigaea TaxID=1348612 RepID=A0A397H0V5_9GLOM|nr:hypothetical protein Glove_402g26 [Diversispora epigaea]